MSQLVTSEFIIDFSEYETDSFHLCLSIVRDR